MSAIWGGRGGRACGHGRAFRDYGAYAHQECDCGCHDYGCHDCALRADVRALHLRL